MEPGMGKVKYRFFIAGIIQGSSRGLDVHDQNYRRSIKQALIESFPDADILCPVEAHPESVTYADEKARDVFLHHLAKVRESHGLVAYLPEASMGSAIELWEAYRHKTVKLVVSPMSANWVIRILADRLFADLEAFETFVRTGQMKQLLESRFGPEGAFGPKGTCGSNPAEEKA
jgi:hypothetical protein